MLGLAWPDPPSGDPTCDRHVPECEVRERDSQSKKHVKRIDFYNESFLLDTKQATHNGAKEFGHGKGDSNAWYIAMK